jgi:hypothetical protein
MAQIYDVNVSSDTSRSEHASTSLPFGAAYQRPRVLRLIALATVRFLAPCQWRGRCLGFPPIEGGARPFKEGQSGHTSPAANRHRHRHGKGSGVHKMKHDREARSSGANKEKTPWNRRYVPVELSQRLFEENRLVPWPDAGMPSGGWYLNH